MASQVAAPSSLHTVVGSSTVSLSSPGLSPSTPSSSHLSPDEVELLAKLEEQNRLLETDSKSLRSVNGSRRNSGSSLVSSSSASSNLSHLEEDSWILWGRIVNEWEEVRKKKEKQLKELVRKGIPHHFRAIVWQLLCSAQNLPIKDQYSELLKMTSPCEKLIRRDIARTYPEHEFFKEKDSLGQEVLFNVMKAYSLVDREVGYCQGSAFIVGLLLMQMPEEEAFCVFVKLMQDYRLRELFKPSMAELGLCMYQFESMIQEQLPELHIHFQAQSFHTSMYASSWFLTIFLTSFPLTVATRIFDIFMCEYFQRVIPHQLDSGPDKVIQVAYQVKYNAKKMKKLEKEYTTIKTKEMEEQVEIKGAGGIWATVGRRSRGGRRVHRQRQKRKGKSVGLRIGTLNVGTMTGNGRELDDMMERRKVDILCVQETRWKGSKTRSIGAGFKLFYYGVDSKRNGVGVVLKEEFVRNVLEVKRVSDRVMSLKLEIEGVMLNVVSGYAPQVGCELEEKERFWSELDEVMESIPTGERVVIGADFNGHVSEGNRGDEEVMGKFGVKEKNLEGQMVVDFAKRMDMGMVNTYFQKREEHRVTYKSGGRRTWVNYILCRRGNLKEISDCKVVVGESVARQHRMVVCRMTLMVCKKKRSKI
ncbi:hypothetical protein QTP86_006633 [Hemibagrus guttatus]|nr:hypothetical protein QTP86_006633 [Hemibagrus guttatus]